MLALRALAFWSLILPLTASAQTTLRLLPAQGEMTTVQVEDIEKEDDVPQKTQRPTLAKKTPLPKPVENVALPKETVSSRSMESDIELMAPDFGALLSEPRTTLELKPNLELKPAFPPHSIDSRPIDSRPIDSRSTISMPTTIKPLHGRSLMTVQVEDIEDLPMPDRRTFDNSTLDTLASPRTSTGPNDPEPRLSDAARRQQAKAAQLARLQTPIGNVHLTGLASNVDQPPNQAMGIRVSRRGFMSTVVSGHEHFGPDVPRTSTPYLRRHLFFEDAPLERLGESGGNLPTGWWTNPRSFAKFTADTIRFPLRAWIDRPDELVIRQAK